MKHSLSSARLWALALVIVVLTPGPWMVRLSDASQNSEEAPSAEATSHLGVRDLQQRHHHRSHPHGNSGAANSGSLRKSASWCQHCPLHPPPQPPPHVVEGEEIDPRYGVEKRLVPTGPNPLHN